MTGEGRRLHSLIPYIHILENAPGAARTRPYSFGGFTRSSEIRRSASYLVGGCESTTAAFLFRDSESISFSREEEAVGRPCNFADPPDAAARRQRNHMKTISTPSKRSNSRPTGPTSGRRRGPRADPRRRATRRIRCLRARHAGRRGGTRPYRPAHSYGEGVERLSDSLSSDREVDSKNQAARAGRSGITSGPQGERATAVRESGG